MQFSKVSTVALLFATLIGSVAFNPAKASAEVDIRLTNQLTNQQNRISVVNRDREINHQRALETQRLAEQRAREQQQRLAQQRQQQRLAEQRSREQQQRLAEQRTREQQQRLTQYHR